MTEKKRNPVSLALTNDLVIKAVCGRDTPECKRDLIALLNLILE